MRRRLVVIACCLLAGVVLTIATSSLIGSLVDPRPLIRASGYKKLVHRDHTLAWQRTAIYRYDTWAWAHGFGILARAHQSSLLDHSWQEQSASAEMLDSPHMLGEVRYGLPFRSTQAWYPSSAFAEFELWGREIDGPLTSAWQIGYPTPFGEPKKRHYRRVAVRPYWPGLLGNTVLYTGLVWLVAFGPFAARRLHRRRRNRCVRCGYELKGLGTCPECGTNA